MIIKKTLSVIEELRQLLVLDTSTNIIQREFGGWTVSGIPGIFSKIGHLRCDGLRSLDPRHSK
jgi:hypothetical protein